MDEDWTTAKVMVHNLQTLMEQYEQAEEDGELDEVAWWEDEYGSDLTEGIDCHVIFEGDPPCLLDERHLNISPTSSQEKIARDEACAECKARWLMRPWEG